jgi:hypothetical protein
VLKYSTLRIFCPLRSSRMTAMQVTSLPVPAVVGMTIWGVCGRVRSCIPSKFSMPPPSVRRMQTIFPVSMTLPPPTLTTQSAPFSRA